VDVQFTYAGQPFCWNGEKALSNFEKHPHDQLRVQNGKSMKTNPERIKQRLRHDRPMTTISIRVPEDVIEDLKDVAPKLGYSGYQPLIRAYIGQGLRKDLARLEKPEIAALEESLKRHGVDHEVISAVLGETIRKSA